MSSLSPLYSAQVMPAQPPPKNGVAEARPVRQPSPGAASRDRCATVVSDVINTSTSTTDNITAATTTTTAFEVSSIEAALLDASEDPGRSGIYAVALDDVIPGGNTLAKTTDSGPRAPLPPAPSDDLAAAPGDEQRQIFVGQLPIFIDPLWLVPLLNHAHSHVVEAAAEDIDPVDTRTERCVSAAVRRSSGARASPYALVTLTCADEVSSFRTMHRCLYIGQRHMFLCRASAATQREEVKNDHGFHLPAPTAIAAAADGGASTVHGGSGGRRPSSQVDRTTTPLHELVTALIAADAEKSAPETRARGLARACVVVGPANPPPPTVPVAASKPTRDSNHHPHAPTTSANGGGHHTPLLGPPSSGNRFQGHAQRLPPPARRPTMPPPSYAGGGDQPHRNHQPLQHHHQLPSILLSHNYPNATVPLSTTAAMHNTAPTWMSQQPQQPQQQHQQQVSGTYVPVSHMVYSPQPQPQQHATFVSLQALQQQAAFVPQQMQQQYVHHHHQPQQPQQHSMGVPVTVLQTAQGAHVLQHAQPHHQHEPHQMFFLPPEQQATASPSPGDTQHPLPPPPAAGYEAFLSHGPPPPHARS